MKKKDFIRKIVIYLLTFAIWLSGIAVAGNEEIYGEEDREITICIEVFSIGNGYLVEPVKVKVQQGDTLADVLVRTILDNGWCCYYGGTTKSSFYLSYIANGDKKNKRYDGYSRSDLPATVKKLNIHTDISDELSKHLESDMIYYDTSDFEDNYKDILGEFVYTNGSGWMYCVNNEFPALAFSQYTPQNGDVVRVQFTLCYGADIGGAYAMGDDSEIYGTLSENYYDVANKDKLTELVADINTNYKSAITNASISEKYKNAVKVLTDVRAAQSQADSAYNSLNKAFAGYKENNDKQQTSGNSSQGANNNSNAGSITGSNPNAGSGSNTVSDNVTSNSTGTDNSTTATGGNKNSTFENGNTGTQNGEGTQHATVSSETDSDNYGENTLLNNENGTDEKIYDASNNDNGNKD
ncbi:MAG: DUF4430 domain-containing protein, partial [Lachnospiraceae bacterium]|nr:DUF4430 domain-containing protein [Lachnospiraceae bacterium]